MPAASLGSGCRIAPRSAQRVPPRSDPNLVDTDRDGTFDVDDNCPRTYNPSQADSGGVATPDAVGDACQNSDFNGDGIFDVLDITLQRRSAIGPDPPVNPALPPYGEPEAGRRNPRIHDSLL